MDLKIPKALGNRVFDNGYSKHFGAVAFLHCKRIRIRQEMDLKIPKALSNRVFDNGYSKHFRAVAFLHCKFTLIKPSYCIGTQPNYSKDVN